MAEISKIKLPSGTTYDIKDTVARAAAAGTIKLRGKSLTALTDESTTNPIQLDNGAQGEEFTASANDAVFYGKKEFVFDGTKWHEFGDMSGLKALAFKDSASGTFTPHGTINTPTFTGSQQSVVVSGLPLGSIKTGSGNANYFPQGECLAPTITVTPSKSSYYVSGSATGGGAVTAGRAASCTLPTLTTSVENELLTLSWTAGSFTTNQPTSVTLPTFTSQSLVTGIQSASATKPIFTGTGVQLVFEGALTYASGNYTPLGTISSLTFTGTEESVTVS